jgi:hypothetical protein
VHEADKPDLVSDFPNTDILTGEHRAEVDFAEPDADPPALGNPDGAVISLWC